MLTLWKVNLVISYMSISPKMNTRLEKIDNLIKRGYKLERTKILDMLEVPLPVLTNNEGKKVNLFCVGPAGFSWNAFFFFPVLYFQIKEYSFYLLVAFIWFSLGNLTKGLIGAGLMTDVTRYLITLLPIVIAIMYASYFPYIRYLQRSKGVKDNNLFLSIVLGLIVYNIAKLPHSWVLGVPSPFFSPFIDAAKSVFS